MMSRKSKLGRTRKYRTAAMSSAVQEEMKGSKKIIWVLFTRRSAGHGRQRLELCDLYTTFVNSLSDPFIFLWKATLFCVSPPLPRVFEKHVILYFALHSTYSSTGLFHSGLRTSNTRIEFNFYYTFNQYFYNQRDLKVVLIRNRRGLLLSSKNGILQFRADFIFEELWT